jgi:hypothetical protein
MVEPNGTSATAVSNPERGEVVAARLAVSEMSRCRPVSRAVLIKHAGLQGLQPRSVMIASEELFVIHREVFVQYVGQA